MMYSVVLIINQVTGFVYDSITNKAVLPFPFYNQE